MSADPAALKSFIGDIWTRSIVPALTAYIAVPNKSPAFDAEWQAHGYMDKAVDLMVGWARARLAGMAGVRLDVVRLPGRTPLIFIEFPGDSDDTVLLYGHLDKQPEMTGWADGLGPWTPVLKGDKLYGRGGADDGYAMFAIIAAILALRTQGARRARCVAIIEACEESGSFDLPHYVAHLAARIGDPSLVICLDSGCGNYDQLWLTTSLRGSLRGVLSIDVLTEGVHSGDASGIVPSSFRIARRVLDRLEDAATGRIIPPELHVDIPADCVAQAKLAAQVLGDQVYARMPFVAGMTPAAGERHELVLNRTWRPALEIIGADGMPSTRDAGNVLRPFTRLQLSLRLPPTLPAEQAAAAVKRVLEADPPYGAKVTFLLEGANNGWAAPPIAAWLGDSVSRASQAAFGRPAALMGEGGSIPFMAMLGGKFPKAQFMITGVLGPHSNAHGPNEFIHLPTAERVTTSVAMVLADHYSRKG